MPHQPVIQFQNVHVDYELDEGTVHAVRGASYEVHPNETLALVGESGCGKSQSCYAAMGLVQPPGRVSRGNVYFRPEPGADPIDLLQFHRNSREMRSIRGGRMAMIFQEPMTALSPVHRIGSQLDEVLRIHTDLGKKERVDRACELLSHVGIPDVRKRYDQYSFEFSGGMRQRIMIAMALACNPRLLIADEPTTGLDVTIQAQIIDLIQRLQEEHDMAVLLITHDLAVVAETADRVAVMYMGRIVEETDVETIFESPRHPYTTALLRSVIGSPLADDGRLETITGSVPGPLERISGCAFYPRCESFMPGVCDAKRPELEPLDDKSDIACFLYDE